MTFRKPAKDWRVRGPGSFCSLGFFILFFCQQLFAQHPVRPDSNLDQAYIPKQRDYSINFGALWEEETFFWMEGHVGFHLGDCLLLPRDSCQSYFDVIGATGVHNNDLANWVMAAWRWQLIDYPSQWSQYIRYIGGVAHANSGGEIRNDPLVALGYGFTRYLHQRVDTSVEVRIGYTHRFFSQVQFGFQIKIDEWVEYFATKVGELGKKTLGVVTEPFKKPVEKDAPPPEKKP